MKKNVLSSGAVMIVALLFYNPSFSQSQDETNILVFSKTAGYRHESIEPGLEAIKQLGQQHGFQVSASEDSTLFDGGKLEGIDVIVSSEYHRRYFG